MLESAFRGGSVCSGGVSAPGGVCSGGVCSRGVSALGGCLLRGGVCSRGCVCSRGGCPLWGVSAPGGCLLPGRCLLREVSALGGVCSRGVCSGGCLLRGVVWTESQTRVKNIPLAITSLRPVTMRLWTLQNNFLPVFCNFLSASIHCILCLGKNADTGIHHKRQKNINQVQALHKVNRIQPQY